MQLKRSGKKKKKRKPAKCRPILPRAYDIRRGHKVWAQAAEEDNTEMLVHTALPPVLCEEGIAGSLSCGGHCPESAATKAHTAPTREQRWMALSVPGLLNAATQKNTGAENEDTKGAMTMMCVERGRRAGRREGVCPLVQERLL